MLQRVLLLALLATAACSASTSAPVLGDATVEDTGEEDTSIEEEDTEPPVVEDTRRADTRPSTDTRPPACIKPGVAGCTAYFDCCEAECQDGRCCKTRLQSTFVCSANAECCDGFCTAGKCCVPPGQKCTLNSMCCSNHCGTRVQPASDGGVTSTGSVCCNPAGNTCAGNDDCCSNKCSAGKCVCLPTGSICARYADSTCCGGVCSLVTGMGYRCN
jgi:hypothetical protein